MTVTARDVPLSALLQEFESVIKFDVLRVDRDLLQRPVTVNLHNAPIRDALAAALSDAGLDFVLTQSNDQRAWRLVAGKRAPGTPSSALQRNEKADRRDPEIRNRADDISPEPSPVPDEPPESEQDRAEREQELKRTLTTVPPRPEVNSLRMLPFPGPDGSPLAEPIGPANAPVLLPFPGKDGAPLFGPPAAGPGLPKALPFPPPPATLQNPPKPSASNPGSSL